MSVVEGVAVFVAHRVYRYEEDTNPDGEILGVFATETEATAACESRKAQDRADDHDHDYRVSEWTMPF